MKIKITLLISFFSFHIFAQNIQGTVVDSNTQKALNAVHITSDDASVVITDEKGAFQLKNHTKYIIASHVGYITQKVEISKTDNQKLTIYLNPDTRKLTEVFISAEKKLKPYIQFTKLASLPKGVYAFAAGISDDKIYVIGGENSRKVDLFKTAARTSSDKYIEPTFNNFISEMSVVPGSMENYSGNLTVYDIKNDVWETSELKFRDRSSHNLHVYNNDIYVMGGKRISGKNIYLDDVIEIYNTQFNTVKKDNVNPHQAVNFASFLYGDYIILMGGVTKITKKGNKQYHKDIHFYNIKSGLWYKLGEMPNPKETKGVLVNDVIYLIGGFNKKALKVIESFNLKTGAWKKEGELFKGIERPALASNGNIIYIYDKRTIATYNTSTKELNEYTINLQLTASELFFHEALYILLADILRMAIITIHLHEKYTVLKLRNFQKLKYEIQKKLHQKLILKSYFQILLFDPVIR
ncbi:carboxypeptidase-like regulatory domain-containing protein [uncultured Kordia sp.]|uniref:Kelch repeat-containing protein n=1 Tax=uncultured Kordia sp. TaxID=507699 RepID=UPI00260A370B|nr:carboxypeptidase-like regulatory domain-containing protein [uncultured Kordia sp.]